MSRFWGYVHCHLEHFEPGTVEAYNHIYEHWTNFLGGDDLAFSATVEDVFRYIGELKHRLGVPAKIDGNRDFSYRTIKKYIAALRSLYRYLVRVGAINDNPFARDEFSFSRKPREKRPHKILPFERVRDLINAPGTGTKEGVRDRALIAVLFYGGLRISEALSLRCNCLGQTPLGNYYLHVPKTKFNKKGEQVISRDCAVLIVNLLKQRDQEGAFDHDPLFTAYRGSPRRPGKNPLRRRAGYDIFKFYCKCLGLGDEFSPHSARATAISKMLDEGVPHRDVQEFSRHSSVAMVEVYDKRHFGLDRIRKVNF